MVIEKVYTRLQDAGFLHCVTLRIWWRLEDYIRTPGGGHADVYTLDWRGQQAGWGIASKLFESLRFWLAHVGAGRFHSDRQ